MSSPDTPGVSLSKVTLSKAAPSVSLSKRASSSGRLRVNLNWNARPAAAGGWWKRVTTSGSIDLDLGCLFDYTDGSKGVVQALGNAFTDRHTFSHGPIVRLDGDDRSGSNSAGENLFVDLAHADHIRRLVVFAYIYDGVPNWGDADGVVTLHPVEGRPVEVRLDEHDPRSTMCGIASLTFAGGVATVHREVRYFSGHRALDEGFGWGLRWTTGSK